MRLFPLLAGVLLAMLMLAWNAPAHPQPAPGQAANAPAQDGGAPGLLVNLMMEVNKSLTVIAQDMLTSNRLGDIKNAGLVVAPFMTNIPDADPQDQMIKLITSWVQEKMLTAMVKNDKDAHFAVVDRIILDNTIQKMKLDADALRDPKNWPAIGQAVDAKYMVTGSFVVIPMNENPLKIAISIEARIVLLETGKVVTADGADLVYKQADPPADP